MTRPTDAELVKLLRLAAMHPRAIANSTFNDPQVRKDARAEATEYEAAADAIESGSRAYVGRPCLWSGTCDAETDHLCVNCRHEREHATQCPTREGTGQVTADALEAASAEPSPEFQAKLAQHKAVKDVLRAWRNNPQTSHDELAAMMLRAAGVEGK